MKAAPLLTLGVIALAFAAASCSPVVEPPERFALLYGVSDYTPASVNDLNFPAIDASSMRDLLVSSGYPPDNIILRTNSAASRENLAGDFEEISLRAQRDSLFLFYFSGHGAQLSDTSGSMNEYIFLDHPTDVFAGSLRDDDFMKYLATIASRQKVVILDACNSGGFIGDFPGVDTVPPEYTGGGVDYFSSAADAFSKYFANVDEGDIPYTEAIVIAAAGREEVSWESSPPDHGVFTAYFLQTPGNADMNSDGWITAVEAYSYAKNRVKSDWNSEYSQAYPFTQAEWKFLPRISGGPLDFVLFPAK